MSRPKKSTKDKQALTVYATAATRSRLAMASDLTGQSLHAAAAAALQLGAIEAFNALPLNARRNAALVTSPSDGVLDFRFRVSDPNLVAELTRLLESFDH